MFCPLWVLKSLRYTTVKSTRQEGYFHGHSQASPRQAHGKKFFAATHVTSQINSTTVERKQTHTLCFHGKASDIIRLFFLDPSDPLPGLAASQPTISYFIGTNTSSFSSHGLSPFSTSSPALLQSLPSLTPSPGLLQEAGAALPRAHHGTEHTGAPEADGASREQHSPGCPPYSTCFSPGQPH